MNPTADASISMPTDNWNCHMPPFQKVFGQSIACGKGEGVTCRRPRAFSSPQRPVHRGRSGLPRSHRSSPARCICHPSLPARKSGPGRLWWPMAFALRRRGVCIGLCKRPRRMRQLPPAFAIALMKNQTKMSSAIRTVNSCLQQREVWSRPLTSLSLLSALRLSCLIPTHAVWSFRESLRQVRSWYHAVITCSLSVCLHRRHIHEFTDSMDHNSTTPVSVQFMLLLM